MERKKINVISFLQEKDTMDANQFANNWKSKLLLPYRETGKRPSYLDFINNMEEVNKRKSYFGEYDYIWIDTHYVHQLDIDDPKTSFNYTTTQLPSFKSVTKDLPHFFVTTDTKFEKKKYCFDNNKVELLCGQASYAHKNSIVYNPDENMNINFENVIPNQIPNEIKESSTIKHNVSENGKWCLANMIPQSTWIHILIGLGLYGQ